MVHIHILPTRDGYHSSFIDTTTLIDTPYRFGTLKILLWVLFPFLFHERLQDDNELYQNVKKY